MGQEESLGQESSQCRLIDCGRVLVHYSPNFNHWFDQLLWRHDIPQSQRRVQDLAHSTRIDNATHTIQALSTWEWGTSVTKFRVVIVLENVSVASAGEVDESRPSRKTHRHAKRELMGRSYVDDFW